MKRLIFFLILTFPIHLCADTRVAGSCSQTDVQTIIDASTDGDTVIIPAGSCTWAGAGCSPVNFTNCANVVINQKQINLLGSGQGVGGTIITLDATTSSYARSAIYANTLLNKPVRISNMKFIAGNQAGPVAIIRIRGTDRPTAGVGWRVDNITATTSIVDSNFVNVDEYNYGLIDHVTYQRDTLNTNGGPAILVASQLLTETNSTYPYDGGSAWVRATTLGSENAVYVEDSIFVRTGTRQTEVADGRAGGRLVLRYNQVWNLSLGIHGMAQAASRGMFSVEAYENTFCANSLSCGTIPDVASAHSLVHAWPFSITSGTGVIYHNAISGFANGIEFENRRTCCGQVGYTCATFTTRCDGTDAVLDGNSADGYPCADQVGRGTETPSAPSHIGDNEALAPYYLWANGPADHSAETVLGYVFDSTGTCSVPSMADHIQLARDVINNGVVAKPGYAAYTYPHPLQGPVVGVNKSLKMRRQP